VALGFALFTTLLHQGCLDDEDREGEDCPVLFSSCDHGKPTTATLKIALSSGARQLSVYGGENVETGRLIYSKNDPPAEINLDLPFGEYAAEARYASGGRTIIAIDGDRLSYSTSEECGKTCYTTEDGKIDLRLVLPP